MDIACLDLEGVLVPEIWIGMAEQTGIDDLKATTRDIPDYDVLMQQRLGILQRNGLGLGDIQSVISEMAPLEGAVEFLNLLRRHFQVAILSDTFYEFAMPLMRQLGYPTLFCNRLTTDSDGRITDYVLRQTDQKRQAVKAFHRMNYRVVASGDSYNDTGMLDEADAGILFRPPSNVVAEFPQYPVTRSYSELRSAFAEAGGFGPTVIG